MDGSWSWWSEDTQRELPEPLAETIWSSRIRSLRSSNRLTRPPPPDRSRCEQPRWPQRSRLPRLAYLYSRERRVSAAAPTAPDTESQVDDCRVRELQRAGRVGHVQWE